MWDVLNTDEYADWFLEQTEADQAVIRSRVFLLREKGPNLSRPYSETLKGSALNNLKELTAKTSSQVFRVAYCFDEARKALLLIGGNKKGKDQRLFYTNLIKEAERIYKLYLGKQQQGDNKDGKAVSSD